LEQLPRWIGCYIMSHIIIITCVGLQLHKHCQRQSVNNVHVGILPFSTHHFVSVLSNNHITKYSEMPNIQRPYIIHHIIKMQFHGLVNELNTINWSDLDHVYSHWNKRQFVGYLSVIWMEKHQRYRPSEITLKLLACLIDFNDKRIPCEQSIFEYQQIRTQSISTSKPTKLLASYLQQII